MKKVKVVLDQFAKMPERAHDSDAGYDLFARENRTVPSGGSIVFDTGCHMSIPSGYAGLIVAKSGLNVNHGITATGLIDSGYTGSIRVKLYNHGREDYAVLKGDKIAQIVILKVEAPELLRVTELEQTDRGSNGFGSTGR